MKLHSKRVCFLFSRFLSNGVAVVRDKMGNSKNRIFTLDSSVKNAVSKLATSIGEGEEEQQRGLVTYTYFLHSFRVWIYIFSTRFECEFTSSPLVSSVVLHLPHSFRVYFLRLLHSFRVWIYIFSTRFECTDFSRGICKMRTMTWEKDYTVPIRVKSTLETSGEDVKVHSKRVEKM